MIQLFTVINTVEAASIPTKTSGLIPECATDVYGASTIECGMQLFYGFSNIILGLIGTITLAIFIYGGLLYMMSQGDSTKVQKATKALSGGVIGLLIVFGAYAAVTFTVNSLRGQNSNTIIPDKYFTCNQIKESVDKNGKLIKAEAPINDGQPCAPGFTCQNGICEDQIVK